MTVTVDWYDPEETILLYTYTDPWTWEECVTAIQAGRDMMRSKSHDVPLLHDMLASSKLPSSVLSKTVSVIKTRPENTGLTVFVTSGTLQQRLFDVLTRIIPQLARHYIMVTTIAEAEAAIRESRGTQKLHH